MKCKILIDVTRGPCELRVKDDFTLKNRLLTHLVPKFLFKMYLYYKLMLQRSFFKEFFFFENQSMRNKIKCQTSLDPN